METLLRFQVERASSLNSAGSPQAIREFWEPRGVAALPFMRLYELFDGEQLYGAWFPGYRISPLAEVADLAKATEDSWAWIEEQRGESHPMRNFVPLISSLHKTSVGPLFDERSSLHGYVVEYRYESGEIQVWSTSAGEFIDAFFGLSIARGAPQSVEDAVTPMQFSPADVDFLARWPRIVFPVHLRAAIDVATI